MADARSRLGKLADREVWRSLEELARTDDFEQHLHREFRVPIDSGVDRRELLTLMGASMALAGLTGCTRQPTERIYPYVQAPEEITVGEPLFYATAHVHGGFARGIVAESYEGRPTKVEGNALHPASLGGTDVFAQAFVLGLYDPDRCQTLTERGEIRPWSALLAAVRLAIEKERPRRGAGLRFLTPAVTSPTFAAQMAEILAAFPEAKWISWEPVSRDAVYAGARLAFGRPLEPQYAFAKADVVLSLEMDFLAEGPSQPSAVRDFASRRRGVEPNRLYVAESTPTLTGARADHRRPLDPPAIEALARAVAAAVGALPNSSVPSDAFAAAAAEDLLAHRGAGLVLAGAVAAPRRARALPRDQRDARQRRARRCGTPSPSSSAPRTRRGALAELAAEMREGRVSTLAVLGGNPVLTAPADLRFSEAMEKVPLRLRLSLYDDETSRLCHWQIAEAHSLESWSDARAADGTATILQPLILPLYGGKSAHEFLAAFSEQTERTAHDLVKDFWRGKLPGADFEAAWRRALHDGVVADTAFPEKPAAVDRTRIAAALAPAAGAKSGALHVLFRPDPTVWDGAYANNGWLQELPKPLTKLTWDNAAMLAPTTAEKLGVTTEDRIDLLVEGRQISAPVWVLPGQAEDCVTLHLGYGRRRGGRTANGKGFNAYPLRDTAGLWSRGGLEIRKAGGARCSPPHSIRTAWRAARSRAR